MNNNKNLGLIIASNFSVVAVKKNKRKKKPQENAKKKNMRRNVKEFEQTPIHSGGELQWKYRNWQQMTTAMMMLAGDDFEMTMSPWKTIEQFVAIRQKEQETTKTIATLV